MYNIIDSKYRGIFLICIIGILLFLFINSGAVVEGYKKINIKNESKSDLTKAVKAEVKAQLPSLVSGILATSVTDNKNMQSTISTELRKLSSSQANLNKNIDRVNKDMQNTAEKHNDKLKKTYDELSTNLSQQYEMYKTGLLHENSETTNSIKNMNKNVLDASEKAVVARDKAQEYADSTNKIYNDVFGKLTTQVIQQDNANFSAKATEAFTPMNGTGYTTKTGPNNTNLFDLEKELVIAINDFNTSYYNFIRCSSGSSINCGNKPSIQEVEEKSKLAIRVAERLKTAYEEANIQTNDGTFKKNHQEIMDKSKSIDELRGNLDIKMDAILKSRNPPNELTQQYDSTVYTGVMWSVLATSVLFYIFTEM